MDAGTSPVVRLYARDGAWSTRGDPQCISMSSSEGEGRNILRKAPPTRKKSCRGFGHRVGREGRWPPDRPPNPFSGALELFNWYFACEI